MIYEEYLIVRTVFWMGCPLSPRSARIKALWLYFFTPSWNRKGVNSMEMQMDQSSL